MSRYFFAISLLFASFISTRAQRFGNEWINYSQSYFKLKVSEDGVYRIDYNTLINAGFPASSVNAKNLQLFNNGAEQYIYVFGENDNTFDPGDYIEFYGRKNTGELDSQLYKRAWHQPHAYYSLFTDTSAYFLTWGNVPGKRMSTLSENNFYDFTAETYFMHEEVAFFNDVYSDGPPIAQFAQYSEYTEGEGWLGTFITLGQTQNRSINSRGYYNAGPAPELQFKIYGKSDAQSSNPDYNHHFQVLNVSNTVLFDGKYQGYFSAEQTVPFPGPSVTGPSTTIRFRSVNDLGAASDATSIAFIKLRYPRSFDLQGSTMFGFMFTGLEAASRGHIEFSNYSALKDAPLLYDLSNHIRIRGEKTNPTRACFLVPNQGSLKRMYICDSADIKVITAVEPVSFRQYDPANEHYQYVIITHPQLTGGAYQFASYKKQEGYDTLVAFVNDLYDQFAYGQAKHPVAIRHFCDYLLANSGAANKPEYLLLLGKGQTNDRIRKSAANYNLDLVPTAGIPPSDLMLTAGLGGAAFLEPGIATGRLPARNNQHITDYINKLIAYRNRPTSIEDKKILHLAAGRTSDENIQFTGILNDLAVTAKDSLLGASVVNISSTDVFPGKTTKQAIIEQLNGRLQMMTFLGHAASTSMEIDMGTPQDVNLLPFMYFSGCLLGNTYTDTSLAEAYLFTPDKGALVWCSNSGFASLSPIIDYNIVFYSVLFGEGYGDPVSRVIKETIKLYGDSSDAFNLLQSRQVSLQGDPSLIPYHPAHPEFAISAQDITIPPEATADDDSFYLSVTIKNAGKVLSDTVPVTIKRTLPDNSVHLYSYTTKQPVYNSDIFSFVIPGLGPVSKGFNRFEINIDPNNTVEELSPPGKANNKAVTDIFINSAGIDLLYPLHNSICGKSPVALRVQSSDPLQQSIEYIIEIDTVPDFSSPFKINSGVLTSTHLAQWMVNLLPKDSMVYYWRARYNLPANQGGQWRQRTFTYINGSPDGWAWFNHDQAKNASVYDLLEDTAGKRFDFGSGSLLQYSIATAGSDVVSYDRKIRLSNNSTRFGFIGNGVVIMAFKPVTYERYLYSSSNNLPANNGADPYYSSGSSGNFYFNTTTATGRDSMRNHIERIPQDYIVLMHNGANTGIYNWSNADFAAVEKLGGQKIRDLAEGYPYILYGKKGMSPGQAVELVADTIGSSLPAKSQVLSSPFFFYVKGDAGGFTTENVGPASKWKYFYCKPTGYDSPGDEYYVTITGIDTIGNEVEFASQIVSDTFNLDTVNASLYPFMKVRYDLSDIPGKSALNIQKMAILFDAYPEGTMNPLLGYSFYKDTLDRGDTLKFSIAFQNISPFSFDSLDTRITIGNSTGVIVDNHRYAPLKPDSSFVISGAYPTAGMTGPQKLEILVNPNGNQREQNLANNYFAKHFYVNSDKINPLLDVTFDGSHIFDNDIIAPSPFIRVSVSDENTFLVMNDTGTMDIYIKYPGQSNFSRINYTDPELVFVPAQGAGKNNKAYIDYHPLRWASGTYEMRVTARDKSGNPSGAGYEVKFRIIRESSITNIYPYPNPFTSQCRFVFTLTGEKLPDQMQIQIMTISGKVVKEIDMGELGSLRIGNNITEYAWNGTDQFGDALANGVYLYRVTARIGGKNIKLMESSGDNTFNNGYGKLYLLR